MKSLFELELLDGPAGARFRRRRPGSDDLPWGTLDPRTLAPAHLDEARRVWTSGAFTEYASAAAFTAMAAAFLECRAPIDLIAAASDCAVDEISHTELAARLVAELGGAVPLEADFGALAPLTSPGAPALVRAAELAIKVSCVGEALSVPVLSASLRSADHPLTRAVLARVLRDEGAHARIGHWFFAWAADRFGAEERAHLGDVARRAIAVYAPLWSDAACERCELVPAVGGVDKTAYRRTLRDAVERKIVPSLSRWGIAA